MKSPVRFQAGLVLAGLALSVAGRAQSVPPPARPDAPAASNKEEALVLSPFQVSENSDEGYAARDTLAGTRFKSDLKDVPSQVSIMTKDFLDDIAASTIDDAYRYSLNIENSQEYSSPTAAGGDFSNTTLNTRSSNRIRGLTNPGTTHDFFLTTVLQDTYNLERISVLSGPNAILFGNGNPGGIVDSSFVRAQLQRPKYSVTFRDDNYNSFRTSIDLNQPLLKDRLGLRVAALNSNLNYYRDDSGRNDQKLFTTVTAKPFKLTVLRAYFEGGSTDQTPFRNVRFGDGVTPWILAGRPAFNNGLTNPTVINASNSGIFARETQANNLLVLNSLGTAPQMIFGSAASANIALATTRYTAQTVGPGATPNQTGVDSYIYSLPHNENILSFEANPNGNGTRNLLKSKIWGFAWEQDLTHHLFFEADFNRERVRQPVSDVIRGISSQLFADPNLYLSDRVTPNPNFGRYYIEAGGPRTFVFRGEKTEWRAMLSYELDFTQHVNWVKWLGHHKLAGMFQYSENMEVQQEFGPTIVPAGVSDSTVLDNYGGPTYRTFGVRQYIGGGMTALSLPFDPLGANGFKMPDGSTYYGGYSNPYGGQSAANMINNLLEGRVLAMQNFWLKDRLVTTFGWRRDNVRQATYITPRKTAAASSAFVSVIDAAVPENWSAFTAGNTKTMGAVAHVTKWLSVYLNKSSTWTPPTGLVNPDDGTPVPGAIGKGKDYGIMMRLFDGKLSLRLDRYDNTSGPTTNTAFRNAIIPTVQNIEQTLINRKADGTIASFPLPQYYDATQATYALSTLTSDMVSTGYEFEVTYNPTKNWRISANAAKETSTQSNIGRSWINFIQQRAATWQQNAALTGPGPGATTTVGTMYLSLIQTLNQMQQSDGQKVEDGRDWRANLVTRYTFSETSLRGAFIGTAMSWRSKQNLGYLASLVDNQFKFPGAPAQVLVPAIDAPIWGKSVPQIEAFLGYQHRIGQKVMWRGQLNIRNLLDNDSILDQRANIAAGFVSVYAVPEPRSFILTNTFSF